jgi:predicted dehydrogenase/threonine dehydrogenase-like Zn-dependent dehydrogenase
MKQVLIREGGAAVVEVPAPQVSSKNILVRVAYSCISVGTEMASVQNSALPLYKRALKQPQNVQRVIEMARTQGIARTLARVQNQLAAGTPSGYSAAGTVIAVGAEVVGFSIGDRVACAGAGIANHAEVIDVPVNLSVSVPDELRLDLASTVTLGAIAMQGVRRAQPTLGETFVVVGLGILGQLTAQILAANGCRVIGTDLDARRIAVARGNGMDIGIDATVDDYVDRVLKFTDGLGADGVIVTAASESDRVIREAMHACRKKGRLVLVGDVGLNLQRADFYQKELDFLISASYGPGRYDPTYEEGGQDYPVPYVRWTENRNMQAYIALLASGKVNLESLYTPPFDIDRAADAYAALRGNGEKPLLAILAYPETQTPIRRVVRTGGHSAVAGKIRVGLVGASSFAQGMHLPNMESLSSDFHLRAVASRTGTTALAVATRYKADYCATDYEEILRDNEIDLVMITTRHDLHGSLTLRALRAGKNVFVEKPLAILPSELDEIEDFYRANPNGPLLMVGYNRRFSPAIQSVRDMVAGSTTPLIVNYRMNAGYLPKEHWVHGAEGGGRNIGEACHIYDLFTALCGGAKVESVRAFGADARSPQWLRNDNFVAVLKYDDGSVCSLTYTAMGEKSYPKERMEIFADGKVVVMDDYKSVTAFGSRRKGWSAKSSQKGQLQELEALAAAHRRGKAWPISLPELLQTSRVSFDVERQISPASEVTVLPPEL